MKCFHPNCNVSPGNGGALFRINAKGVPGIWACRQHLKNTDAPPIDPTVDKIARALASKATGEPPATSGDGA